MNDLLNEILDNQENHTLILNELIRRLIRVETRICVLASEFGAEDAIHSVNGPK